MNNYQCRYCGERTGPPKPGSTHTCKTGNFAGKKMDVGWCMDYVPYTLRETAFNEMLRTLKDAREVLVVSLSWPASSKIRHQINEAIRKGDEAVTAMNGE